MKIVIDIPEDEYSWLKEHPNSIRWSSVYTDSILNGTPLDDIKKEIIDRAKRTMNDTRAEGIYMALQIIDKHTGKEK